MLALLAFVAFLIGLIVRVAKVGFEFSDVWFWLLLGLALLSLDAVVPISNRWIRRNP